MLNALRNHSGRYLWLKKIIIKHKPRLQGPPLQKQSTEIIATKIIILYKYIKILLTSSTVCDTMDCDGERYLSVE